ncbi:MAG: hypothetical protein EXS13_06735 [Planctomycetes bacterium]|nr:hypothetical protein [Planctomycetota bacterium]
MIGAFAAPAARATQDDPEKKSCCHEPAARPSGGVLPMDRKSVLLREAAERLKVHGKYADLLAQYGRYDEALVQLEKALEMAEAIHEPRAIRQVLKDLGVVSMRKGELQNCIGRHNQGSCLFPLAGAAIHVDRDGSEAAMRWFTRLLERVPTETAAMWLLNVAATTLGTYPDSVPEQWRIPPEKLRSEHEMPRMFDRAAALGITGANRAGGSIFDDFNGDGRIDLVVSSMDTRTPLRLWLQRDSGKFDEVTDAVGRAGQLGGLQVFHFDADNNGRLDLLVQRGGWMGTSGELPNSLLMQQQDGTFLDRTLEAGIEISAPSQAAAMAEVDLDGDLDLFLGYEGAGERYPSLLFLNRGDGTFEDGSRKWGLHGCGFGKGCAFGDYDRDGWLDLYASGYPNIDRTGAMGKWWVEGVASCELNKLYRNNRLGGFEDVTAKVGLDRVAFPMGSSFGDLDNDGWNDIYPATGAPDYATLFPNVKYRNAGGIKFQDVTTASGTGLLQKGHGVGFADFDGDGDQDVFAQTGGAYADDTFANACYINPGHGHHWLTVRLQGAKSNRFGLGARIRVRFADGDETRDVYGYVGACSSFGGDSFLEEIGLGDASKILELEVEWPASRTKQSFVDVPLDRIVRVVEGKAALELVAGAAAVE